MTQETSAIPQKSVEIPQETVEVLVTRQTHVIKPIKLAEKSKKSIELSEEWKFNVQKRQIEEIKKSIEKENMEVTGRRQEKRKG